jgi:hypothetical protein
MLDLSNINVNVTASIDNTSIVKLAAMFLALIILYFLFKHLFA